MYASPMPALEPLLSRHSTPSRQLGEPGPDDAALAAMLQTAVHVPDHGKLTPWRFLRLRGAARARLGELLVERQRERDPATPTAVLDKDRERFNYAPVVIAVVARIARDHKIPEQEQLLSAGCVCFSLLHAAHALGYGAQWLTGWAAYDEVIARKLGLSHDERVIGFVHIGTVPDPTPDRPRPDALALLTEWTGA